jgi:hypothetical protein
MGENRLPTSQNKDGTKRIFCPQLGRGNRLFSGTGFIGGMEINLPAKVKTHRVLK